MRHLSAVSISEATMLELRDNLNLTVSLTVWGNQGPTIVRRVESHQMQFAVMRVGSVLPLLSSNNGRIFLAYLDRRYTHSIIEAELAVPDGAAAKAGLRTMQDVEKLGAAIRANRVVSDIALVSGFATMSAPIFDITNSVTAALTLIGTQDDNLAHTKPVLLPPRTGCRGNSAPPACRRRRYGSSRDDDARPAIVREQVLWNGNTSTRRNFTNTRLSPASSR